LTKGPKIYSFRHFVILKADFGPFSKREEKTKIRAEIGSHGTRDSDASTSPSGGAPGVPLRTPYLYAVLRIAAAFGPRTPHILRRSCVVSLQKRALKTARSSFEPDVMCAAAQKQTDLRRHDPPPGSAQIRLRSRDVASTVWDVAYRVRDMANFICNAGKLWRDLDQREWCGALRAATSGIRDVVRPVPSVVGTLRGTLPGLFTSTSVWSLLDQRQQANGVHTLKRSGVYNYHGGLTTTCRNERAGASASSTSGWWW